MRDELARVLAETQLWPGAWDKMGEAERGHFQHLADGALASDWLARVRAEERGAALGLAHECIVMEKDDERHSLSPNLRLGLSIALTILNRCIVESEATAAAIRERGQ